MLRSEIEEKVKTFLVEDFEYDEETIVPEARLKEDIGVDSLDLVDLVVVVNRDFGFRLKNEEMVNIKTLSQFCDYIEQHTTR